MQLFRTYYKAMVIVYALLNHYIRDLSKKLQHSPEEEIG